VLASTRRLSQCSAIPCLWLLFVKLPPSLRPAQDTSSALALFGGLRAVSEIEIENATFVCSQLLTFMTPDRNMTTAKAILTKSYMKDMATVFSTGGQRRDE